MMGGGNDTALFNSLIGGDGSDVGGVSGLLGELDGSSGDNDLAGLLGGNSSGLLDGLLGGDGANLTSELPELLGGDNSSSLSDLLGGLKRTTQIN